MNRNGYARTGSASSRAAEPRMARHCASLDPGSRACLIPDRKHRDKWHRLARNGEPGSLTSGGAGVAALVAASPSLPF